MTRSLRLALVSPRFEPVTAVGAEVQIAKLARLMAGRGHRVEVLTTCVRDGMTGKNHYHPGRTREGPFTLRRFPADPRPLSRRRLEIERRIGRGEPVTREEQETWMRGVGFSSELRDHVARSAGDTDAFIFAPALSGTTWSGLEAAAERSLLLTALPDGPEARLETVKELLGRTPVLLAGSVTERDLLQAAGLPPERVIIAAAACETAPEYDPGRFRRRHGLEVPFLLYAGRRTPGKGVDRLIEYVTVLVRSGGLDLRLVLTGSEKINIPPEARDLVLDLNFIEEQDKADGMAACLAFCQPSRGEGLGIAPLEAWLAGRPVLAETGGGVTRERCRASGGGLWYGNCFEFGESVRLLMKNEDLAGAMGEGGRAFVRRHHSWEDAVERIERACAGLASGKSGSPS
jgi:glycosyltransferase involved in cell wall biosynthesis